MRQWADLAPVAFLAGAAAALPSFIDRASPNTQVTRKTAQAKAEAREVAVAKTRAAQAATVGAMSLSEET
jgi:hypothetical protein